MSDRALVLDTHVWIWWLGDRSRLSPRIARRMAQVTDRNPVCVSAISVWELYMLVSKGRLLLESDPAHWVRQCELSRKIRFVPVDPEIARISVQLSRKVPEDPADRMIVATAVSLGATLITRDEKIRSSGAVQTLW